jgi:hypothetical protein
MWGQRGSVPAKEIQMTEQPTVALSPETVKVGDGVTYHVGSDRYAGTVTHVSPSGRTFRFTFDKATATGDYYGHQSYTYESVPEVDTNYHGFTQTNVHVARWNAKANRFKCGSSGVSAGRNQYSNPSF